MMEHDLQSTSDQNRALDTAPETSGLNDFRLSRSQRAMRSALHLLDNINPTAAAHLAAFFFLRPRRKPVTYTRHLPAGAEKITLYYNLARMNAYSWGAGHKTILLVHGWESHIGQMLPLVTPLVQAGFRVVALDSPGHGQSPKLLTNMYDVGEAVRCALEQLAPVHGLIANSFGAAAAMTALARYPDIQPGRIILLSPMAHINQHLSIYKRLVGIDGRLEANMLHILQQRLPLPLDHFDVAQAVTHIDCPGMIIHDRYDPVIPFESSQHILANWPNAAFMETRNLGHKKLIGSPTVQAAVVNFFGSDHAFRHATASDTHYSLDTATGPQAMLTHMWQPVAYHALKHC